MESPETKSLPSSPSSPTPDQAELEVGEIQDRVGKRLLAAGLGFGSLLLAAAIGYAIPGKDWPFLAAITLFFLGGLALLLARRLGGTTRNALLLLLAFAFCVFLLATRGPGGAADVWLFAFAALSALLFGMRGALASSFLVAAAFAAVGLARAGGAASWAFAPRRYLLLALNVATLSLAVGAAFAELLAGFRAAARERARLAGDLAAREAELAREEASRKCAEDLVVFYRDFDSLTKLPNREKFAEETGRAIRAAGRRGRHAAVLATGIDRWKRLVGARGLAVGEPVLVQASSALRSAFRDDDVVARGGPDGFLVLCADVKSADDVMGLLEKARSSLSVPFDAGGEAVRIGASVGVALFPNDGDRPEFLVSAAEAALALAREAGTGTCRLFDARLQAELLARARLEEELEEAVKSDRFEPWFQPKVDRFGRVVGAEALARWILPDGSVRMPASFVAAAERSGEIEGMGRMILRKACASARRWADEGLPPIPVSVNLSPFQFRSPGLVGDVRAALADSGLAPWRLELEITESGLAGGEEASVDALAGLKALGISISIDDFGTGYSSISKLRDLPVDTVKMPKEFVDRLPGDTRSSMIVQSIIDLAHNLRFDVVAEGVESRDQFAWLDLATCDQYQGYLFSPPLPAGPFERALAEGFGAIVQ